jgi:serine/threonine protein kinase
MLVDHSNCSFSFYDWNCFEKEINILNSSLSIICFKIIIESRRKTLNNNKHTTLTTLGNGNFGTVRKCKHFQSGLIVAIKSIPKNHLCELTQNEIQIQSQVDHPFICPVFQTFEDASHIHIVLEYIQNGSLLEYISANTRLSEYESRKFFVQLLSCVDYLHNTLHIVHRDLKLENLLLDHLMNLRLIDFGISKSDGSVMRTICGSGPYSAPEIHSGKSYSFQVDIWAMGIILYTMIAGKLPFDDINFAKLRQKITYLKPDYSKYFSNSVISLLSCLLEKDPNKRISIEQVWNHQWVKEDPKLAVKYKNLDRFCISQDGNLMKRLSKKSRNLELFVVHLI